MMNIIKKNSTKNIAKPDKFPGSLNCPRVSVLKINLKSVNNNYNKIHTVKQCTEIQILYSCRIHSFLYPSEVKHSPQQL